MSDVIRLLPDSVANQIAAGEVIQRPASVIKELVENAVDAGATIIEVIVTDAGRTLIQVVDNGRGMSETDARLAFERHATSKIAKADDLFNLHTMGFRGEALASICAVAQINLRTKQPDAEIGTRLIINGSKVESQEPFACSVGTNLMVKNLFYNVPARRKFLKKDSVELSNIEKEFERMALVNPEVDLTLTSNDTVIHRLLPGTFKQRIADLFGQSVAKHLLPVSTTTSIVKIDGFIASPEGARHRNALQYFTVNGRHMRHPYFHKAVTMCYERLIASDAQPQYFLNFTVDPASIDVNIHPTKNEIKFEDENGIWQILNAAVRESLGRFNAGPGMDFDAPAGFDIPVFNPDASADHNVNIDPTYNPFAASALAQQQRQPVREKQPAITRDWERLYEGFMSETPATPPVVEMPADGPSPVIEGLVGSASDTDGVYEPSSIIQVRNKYIMAPAVSGLMVIDQHRAHVKILYDKFLRMGAGGSMQSQTLLFPEVLALSAPREALLLELQPALKTMGFDFSPLGNRNWSITAMPDVVAEANPTEVVNRILADSEAGVMKDTDESLRGALALSMARSVAIKAGVKLSMKEMEHLISELLRLPTPNYTPDGLAVIRVLSDTEIDNFFK
ncbi:MAG: DNA mismatch repair endonuclease MutL [Paramuribaculum sp.]|nr:DNA mismatch repair endonuclease MutL [Paramuribaculum sp.]